MKRTRVLVPFLVCAAFGFLGETASACPFGMCGRRVTINSQVQFAGAPAPAGIRIKVTADLIQAGLALAGADFRPDLELTTDASGRISGSFEYCGVIVCYDPLVLAFGFRTDFDGGVLTFGAGQTSSSFVRPLNFANESGYRPPLPAPAVKFRMPVQDPSLIDLGDSWPWNLMKGPFGLDHSPPQRGRSLSCVDYEGRGGLIGAPYCYGGHDGTDFMLRGGFDRMDHANNWVVAAADGRLESFEDNHFDRCHAEAITGDGRFFNVDCEGHDPNSDPRYSWNWVTIDHGHGIKTTYGHLKRGSVTRLGLSIGQFVSCGQLLGDIGSSGYSSAPHLHFQVSHNNQVADPFRGRLSHQSYWVNQGSGRIPAATCQNPAELYPNRSFSARVTHRVQDLRVLTAPPLSGAGVQGNAVGLQGPIHWFRVDLEVPRDGLTGFDPQLAQVRFTYPQTAIFRTPQVREGVLTGTFFVPVATARDPRLGQYEFDVAAEVSQARAANPAAARVTSFLHVRLPRPTVRLQMTPRIAQGACRDGFPLKLAAQPGAAPASGEHYLADLVAAPTGFLGSSVTARWTAQPQEGRATAALAATGTRTQYQLCPCSHPTQVRVTTSDGVETASDSVLIVPPRLSVKLASRWLQGPKRIDAAVMPQPLNPPPPSDTYEGVELKAEAELSTEGSQWKQVRPVTQPRFAWNLAWQPTAQALQGGKPTAVANKQVSFADAAKSVILVRAPQSGAQIERVNVWSDVAVVDALGRCGHLERQVATNFSPAREILRALGTYAQDPGPKQPAAVVNWVNAALRSVAPRAPGGALPPALKLTNLPLAKAPSVPSFAVAAGVVGAWSQLAAKKTVPPVELMKLYGEVLKAAQGTKK